MIGLTQDTPLDWFRALEERRSAVTGILLALSVAVLAVTAIRDYSDYDVFWHLQMGKDWLVSGLSPFVDHYSYTFTGAEISAPPVLFQAAIHILVSEFGLEGGFLFYEMGCFLLVLLLVSGWLRLVRAPVVVWCIVLSLLLVLLQLRAQIRPELFSYALSVVALILYRRAGKSLSFRSIGPIALFLLLWTNYHSSVIGYVIFCGLFIDIGVDLIRKRDGVAAWSAWAGWGLLLVAVGFLNPGLVHPVQTLLLFPSEWKILIQEYQPSTIYRDVIALYALLFVAAATTLLAVRQRRFGYLLICAVMIHAGVTMARMATPAGLVLLCLFAHLVSEAEPERWLGNLPSWRRRLVDLLSLCLVLVPLGNGIYNAWGFLAENRSYASFFPGPMVDYMRESGKSGKIFNEYDLGGYLIHHLAPSSQVYIDGRTGILYPVEHFHRYLDAMSSPEAMKSEIERHDIELAILGNGVIYPYLMHEVGFELDFVGESYSLYSRGEANFPVTGMLWARPYCWQERLVESVVSEQEQAASLLPPESALFPLLNITAAYAGATDRKEFIAELGSVPVWDDASLRFAGYRALEHGFPGFGVTLFDTVYSKEPKDYLALALAHLRTGDTHKAEEILDQWFRRQWIFVEAVDQMIVHRLLLEIQESRPLEIIEPGVPEELANQVGMLEAAGAEGQVKAETFCSRPE